MLNYATAEEQKALAAEISQTWDSGEEGRRALAQKITKELQNDVEQRDLSGFIFDKEFIPEGQEVEWKLKSKMKVYWHEPGSYAPRTAVTQRVFTLATDMLSCHPEFEITQLKAGRYGTVSDQMKDAREAMLGAINARIWNTLTGSITSSSPNYANSAGSISKSALDAALTWCNDQPGGGAKAIIARKHILDDILDFTVGTNGDVGVFSDAVKDQIIKTGTLGGVYRGVPLIGLTQWQDAFGKNTISNTDVMVVGGGSGKFVVRMDYDSMDDIDINTLVWHMHVWTRVGVAVFFPNRNYRISLV